MTPSPPFARLQAPPSDAKGVIALPRDGLGIVSVFARRGQTAGLRQRFRGEFGIDLPSGPSRVAAGRISVIGSGPEAWLVTCEDGGNAFCDTLEAALGATASLTDQSDGYAVLRLSGPKVRATLAKLVPLDVHPRAFAVGAFAGTVAAHIAALLWRLEDRGDESPVFEIAVFRSMASSLWHALSSNAAEFGFVVASGSAD